MGKRIVRITLLPVIVVVALVASTGAGAAQAAPNNPAARVADNAAASPDVSYDGFSYSLAPCTYPLYGQYPECESTSPVVDRWYDATAAASSCVITWTVDWGDGSTSTNTFTDPSPGLHLIASHTYSESDRRYVEIASASVVSGPCTEGPSQTFLFDYDTSSIWQAWWDMNGLPASCIADQFPDPISVGLSAKDLGYDLGVFSKSGNWYILYGVGKLASGLYTWYSLFKMAAFDCAPKLPDPPLPPALDYGVSHLGKLFKASLQPIPEIAGVDGYQKGNLYYFSLHYSDPGHDAMGFGFVGVNGSGWAAESHPFFSPSYGIVGQDSIDYPFNLECGTAQEYKSQVEAWIYNSQGLLSTPIQIALTCTT